MVRGAFNHGITNACAFCTVLYVWVLKLQTGPVVYVDDLSICLFICLFAGLSIDHSLIVFCSLNCLYIHSFVCLFALEFVHSLIREFFPLLRLFIFVCEDLRSEHISPQQWSDDPVPLSY